MSFADSCCKSCNVALPVRLCACSSKRFTSCVKLACSHERQIGWMDVRLSGLHFMQQRLVALGQADHLFKHLPVRESESGLPFLFCVICMC